MQLGSWRPLLLSAADAEESVALFSVSDIWGARGRLPPSARLVDYLSARDATLPPSPYRSVLELSYPSLTLKNGLVLLAIESHRGPGSLAVVDVAGGCCRRIHQVTR